MYVKLLQDEGRFITEILQASKFLTFFSSSWSPCVSPDISSTNIIRSPTKEKFLQTGEFPSLTSRANTNNIPSSSHCLIFILVGTTPELWDQHWGDNLFYILTLTFIIFQRRNWTVCKIDAQIHEFDVWCIHTRTPLMTSDGYLSFPLFNFNLILGEWMRFIYMFLFHQKWTPEWQMAYLIRSLLIFKIELINL